MSDLIKLKFDGACAEIILNVPERRNALRHEMWAAIPGLIAEAVADPATHVVVIHGGTAGAFAAGADISEFSTRYADRAGREEAAGAISAALTAVEMCPKPVIAAIEGACVGGGMSLAAACDLRFAAEDARFAITPAKLGLVYPFGDTRRLVDIVGAAAAKDMLFTGRIFPAPEAMYLRLIDRLVPSGEALAYARAYAADISAVSQWSVRAIKTMVARVEHGQRDDSEEAREHFLSGFAGEDFEEGYRAFLDKRRAEFPFKR